VARSCSRRDSRFGFQKLRILTASGRKDWTRNAWVPWTRTSSANIWQRRQSQGLSWVFARSSTRFHMVWTCRADRKCVFLSQRWIDCTGLVGSRAGAVAPLVRPICYSPFPLGARADFPHYALLQTSPQGLWPVAA